MTGISIEVRTESGRNDALRQYASEGLRPQTLLFTLLGRHVLDRDVAVASSTFIETLAKLDVTVQAARSTLTRMVSRGHLVRHRVGRKAYFSISDQLSRVLRDGEERIFEVPVRDLPTNTWTLLSFSIPEEQRADRHTLRAALDWNGFGLLRNGLWIAPGEVDVSSVVDRLGLHERIEIFTGKPAGPTDMQRVVSEAWDLEAIAARHDQFLERWSGKGRGGLDSTLAAHIRLITEWQQNIVADPGLPIQYLPEGWPAMNAWGVFRQRQSDLSAEAIEEFETLLDALPVAQLS